jgi:hypothetical protein
MSTETNEAGYRLICRERGEHRIAMSGLTGFPYCLDCDYEWGEG